MPALGDRVVAGLLRGGARGRHQGLVIVERDQPQDQIGRRRVAGADERLGVARAVLELEPHDNGLVHFRQRGRDMRRVAGRQRERRGDPRAELKERTPVDPGGREPGGQR